MKFFAARKVFYVSPDSYIHLPSSLRGTCIEVKIVGAVPRGKYWVCEEFETKTRGVTAPNKGEHA